jgi:hypothetical protein
MDEFSEAFATWLRQRRPAWLGMAKAESASVEIAFASPNPRAVAPVWISSADEELTVGFDYTHGHFNAWMGTESDEDVFERALQFADDLVGERLVVVSGLAGGAWAGSTTVPPGDDPLATASVFPEADTIIVRSFRGTFDRDLPRGPAGG